MKKYLIILSGAMMLIVASLLTGGARSLATTETLNQSGVLGSQAPNACGSGDVGGTVFRELPVNGASLNTYGVKDDNEPGVEGVTVTVVDANGASSTYTTDSDGSWKVTPAAYPVRVEFTVPLGLSESLSGSDSPTSVQFVGASDCSVDFGVHYPGDYSNDVKPFIVIPKMYNGTVGPRSDAALFSFDYTQQGFYNDEDGQHKDYTAYGDANWEDVGALYGLAYQRETKRLFASALLRRYADLKAGTDAIFVLDYSTTPATVSSHFNLNGINTANGGVIDLGSVCRDTNCDPLGTGDSSDYPLSTDQGAPSRDMDAFDKIGKVGFGDIDLEDGEQTLWAVNLNQRALISIDVSGAALPGTVDQYIITSLPGVPSCTGGELRPWGLKFFEGKGYLGAVCDAQSSGDNANLHAYILSFDPKNVSAGFTPVIDFLLNYERDNNDSDDYPKYFQAWIDAQGYVDNVASSSQGDYRQQVYEQPFLADIEFFDSNTMFIGIGDRFGYQMGRSNYPPISGNTDYKSGKVFGDVLRSCKVNGSWMLEDKNNPACPTNYDAIQGVNNNGGEYFFDTGGDKRTESAFGALAIMPGAGHLLSTFNDPYPGDDNFGDEYWNNSGIEWFNLDNGAVERWIQMDPGYDYGSGRDNSFGKANGVGDIELLVDPAPLELGNRLWCDTGSDPSGNGVQDPGETNISGATVILECDTDGDGDYDVSATTTTDVDGAYLFRDGDASLNSFPTAAWDSSLHIIPRNTSCRILVDYSQSAITSACGANSIPTTLNNGQGANADLNDSDGDPAVGSSNQMGVVFTTGASGENDHSFDFGFQQAASLGDFVWWDLDEDGLQDANEIGIEGVTVHLQDPDGNEVDSTLTDAGGHYLFDNLVPGDYTVVFDKPGNDWNLTQPNQGNDSSDSDADPASGQGPLYSLQPGEKDMTIDAGLTIPTSYTISKENTTVTNELVAGDPISFTIVITNTGKTWLSVVPLKDTYDTTYLTYVDADPASDDNTDDGEIVWSDLTLRFGDDLAPGESFTVVTHFTARQHTQDADNHETINTATVFESQADPDGPNGPIGSAGPLDEQSDDAPVSILYPVGESMVGFWAERTGCSVRLWWQTASEADILGFNVLRNSNGRLDRLNESLIFAHEAGADVGSLYRMIDRRVPQEQASYILEIMHLDGRVERYTGQSAPVVRQGKRSCRR